MKFRMKLVALAAMLPLMGAEPAGFKYWSAAQMLETERALAPKMSALKVASVSGGNFGNHSALLLHREASGQAELHIHQADLMVIQSGTATLVVGGAIPQSRHTSRDEIRGPSIRGGTEQKISAGDIIHVPANTPHQLLLDPGHQLNYFTLKVNE